MKYKLEVVLTQNQMETLLKALDSIAKRHPNSAMALSCTTLRLFLKDQLQKID